MLEVLSMLCSSKIVPQGNALLAIGLCMPSARRHFPVTLQPFPHGTIGLCRRSLAGSQVHCPCRMVRTKGPLHMQDWQNHPPTSAERFRTPVLTPVGMYLWMRQRAWMGARAN